jgi:hypothetical protein
VDVPFSGLQSSLFCFGVDQLPSSLSRLPSQFRDSTACRGECQMVHCLHHVESHSPQSLTELSQRSSVMKPGADHKDHKGACCAAATRRQLENPCRRPVLFSTVNLTPRRRATLVIRQLDATTLRRCNDAATPQRRRDAATTPQRRRDTATTPRRRSNACDPSS